MKFAVLAQQVPVDIYAVSIREIEKISCSCNHFYVICSACTYSYWRLYNEGMRRR